MTLLRVNLSNLGVNCLFNFKSGKHLNVSSEFLLTILSHICFNITLRLSKSHKAILHACTHYLCTKCMCQRKTHRQRIKQHIITLIWTVGITWDALNNYVVINHDISKILFHDMFYIHAQKL